MALTYTPPGELGSKCPDFTLVGTDGEVYNREDFRGNKALVVMFICNHCPYVQAVEERIINLAHKYKDKPVQFVGICSNDPTDHPEDSYENLKKRWKEKSYGFPYLHDETQDVAREFGAVCTPDFFVYDRDFKLAYRGRLDDSWKDPTQVRREELKETLDRLLEDKAPPTEQHPSMGCSIKWKN